MSGDAGHLDGPKKVYNIPVVTVSNRHNRKIVDEEDTIQQIIDDFVFDNREGLEEAEPEDSHFVTLDEWNTSDASYSDYNSPVPTKFIRLDNEAKARQKNTSHNSSGQSSPKRKKKISPKKQKSAATSTPRPAATNTPRPTATSPRKQIAKRVTSTPNAMPSVPISKPFASSTPISRSDPRVKSTENLPKTLKSTPAIINPSVERVLTTLEENGVRISSTSSPERSSSPNNLQKLKQESQNNLKRKHEATTELTTELIKPKVKFPSVLELKKETENKVPKSILESPIPSIKVESPSVLELKKETENKVPKSILESPIPSIKVKSPSVLELKKETENKVPKSILESPIPSLKVEFPSVLELKKETENKVPKSILESPIPSLKVEFPSVLELKKETENEMPKPILESPISKVDSVKSQITDTTQNEILSQPEVIVKEVSEAEKSGALSILDGWPQNVKVTDLLVLVFSGDNRIRTLQRITAGPKDPQLFLKVCSAVSNSPLKITMLGLVKCVYNGRVYFKVTAEGHTEIEKGKKTEKIKLQESNGIDCSALFSTDNFEIIKHASTIHIPPSSYEVFIPNLIHNHLRKKARITLLQNLKSNMTYLFMEELRENLPVRFAFPMPLTPCTPFKLIIWLADYNVDSSLQVYCGTMKAGTTSYIQSLNVNCITAVKNLQTYLTKEELRRLADLATGFVVGGKYNQYAYLEFFYRNKPEAYYQNIYNRDNGIMLPYMKDANGDPSSVINGNIKGLFFSAVLDKKTLKPPNFSFFGSKRIYIYAHWMFHDDSNLYFADFYCHYDVHYVTVVLTEPGSATDLFCRDRLLLLNKYNNPFIKLVEIAGESRVYATQGVNVEVFYTEPVDLYYVFNRQMGFLFEEVPTRGRGCSIPKVGIPKKSDCPFCNLK